MCRVRNHHKMTNEHPVNGSSCRSSRWKDAVAGISLALAIVAVVCSIEAKCDEYAPLEWSFVAEVRTITFEWYAVFLVFV